MPFFNVCTALSPMPWLDIMARTEEIPLFTPLQFQPVGDFAKQGPIPMIMVLQIKNQKSTDENFLKHFQLSDHRK